MVPLPKKILVCPNSATQCSAHITHIYHHFEWLPTKHRIDFKTVLTTYNAINNLDLHQQAADANILNNVFNDKQCKI